MRREHRDARRPAHDLGDVLGVDLLLQHLLLGLQLGELVGRRLDPALELGQAAVADLGRLAEVALALVAVRLLSCRLELALELADGRDGVLLGLPVGRHGRLLLLEVGELGLEPGETLDRGRVRLFLEGHLLDLELADPAGDDVDLGRHRVDLDAQPAGGLVDEVDRLVGQEAARHVAVRQHGGRHEGGVLDAHAVVDLVALLQPAQDGDRVRDRRLLDDDGLEAALEGGVLLDVLAVLVEGRRPDEAELAAREHRLDHVAGVHGALGRPGTDDGVQLVDEGDDLALGVRDLLQHRLQALLELAPVLGPGDHGGEVEGDDALVAQALGDVALDDAGGETLDDGRLAHAGLADEDRVVLRASGEDLDDAADLVVAADDGVELALPGEIGEVAAVLLERLVLLLGGLRSDAVAAPDRLQGGEEVLAADAETVGEGEEEVLDGEVLVAHLLAGGIGALEGVVELAAEGRLGGAVGLRDPGEGIGDAIADREGSNPEAVEDRDRHAAVL